MENCNPCGTLLCIAKCMRGGRPPLRQGLHYSKTRYIVVD